MQPGFIPLRTASFWLHIPIDQIWDLIAEGKMKAWIESDHGFEENTPKYHKMIQLIQLDPDDDNIYEILACNHIVWTTQEDLLSIKLDLPEPEARTPEQEFYADIDQTAQQDAQERYEQIIDEAREQQSVIATAIQDADYDMDRFLDNLPPEANKEIVQSVVKKLAILDGDTDPELLRVQEALLVMGDPREATALAMCGSTFVKWECDHDHEHTFYQKLYCGREYCPTCGKYESVIHSRRAHRLYDRLMWMGGDDPHAQTMGHAVLTIPEHLRTFCMDKDTLRKLRKAAAASVMEWINGDVPKEERITPGVYVATHLLGDNLITPKKYAESEGLSVREVWIMIRSGELESETDEQGRVSVVWNTENANKYHPHFHCLFPSPGFTENVEELKSIWAQKAGQIIGSFNGSENAHYHYIKPNEPHKMMHAIKYTVRPLFTAERLPRLHPKLVRFRMELKGWRAHTGYGCLADSQYRRWQQEQGIDMKQILSALLDADEVAEIYEPNICPICGSHMKPNGIVKHLPLDHLEEIRPGIYYWPPETTFQTSPPNKTKSTLNFV